MGKMTEIRFPLKAATIDTVEHAVRVCPPWAIDKFQVIYEGRELGYDAARKLVNQRA